MMRRQARSVREMRKEELPSMRAYAQDVRERVLRHAPAEIQAVWELYKQGSVREFYTCANEPGRVVLVFESASEEEAREAIASF